MSGTIAGGRKASRTNLARHGKDFYSIIGAEGGRAGHTGGFAHDGRSWFEKLIRKPKLAKTAGAKGGRKSRR